MQPFFICVEEEEGKVEGGGKLTNSFNAHDQKHM